MDPTALDGTSLILQFRAKGAFGEHPVKFSQDSKGTFGPKLKHVEITIPNLQKREAKQVTGDVLPQTSCCQTLADMSSMSCTETIHKGV